MPEKRTPIKILFSETGKFDIHCQNNCLNALSGVLNIYVRTQVSLTYFNRMLQTYFWKLLAFKNWSDGQIMNYRLYLEIFFCDQFFILILKKTWYFSAEVDHC